MPGVAQVHVQFAQKFVPSHAARPLIERLERHDRFKHRERRRIGRCFGLSGLAEDSCDFWESFKLSILYLKNLRRFRDRHAWHRCRHVEQSSFVQRRHEFFAEPRKGENRQHE